LSVSNKKKTVTWGTGIRGLLRGMTNLSGALSGQRQSWKTPGELGVSKSMGC